MLPGMGGIDPKQMGKLMQQMGIKSEELAATRVIIEREGSRIVIDEPQITKISMKGESTYQVSGKVREETAISQEDVKMVAEQAKVSEEQAKKALEDSGGDIAEAILKLEKNEQ